MICIYLWGYNDCYNSLAEIVFDVGNNKGNTIEITLDNPALNKIEKDAENFLIHIILYFKEDMTETDILAITKLVDDIFSVSYGYGFKPLKNQDIMTETLIKKNIFSESVKVDGSVTVNTEIVKGKINKFYEYNFLNYEQVEENETSGCKALSDNLFYYKTVK